MRFAYVMFCTAAVATAAAHQEPAERALEAWTMLDQDSSFRVSADTHGVHGGASSGHIAALTPTTLSMVIVQQSFRADQYRGKRVRFSAFMRAANTGRTNGMGVMLFLRAEGGGATLASHTSGARPVSGNAPWTKREIVLDIPARSAGITIGFGMKGPGEVWMDDAVVEVVDTTVAVSRPNPRAPVVDRSRIAQQSKLYAQAPLQPLNLDFEKTK